MAVPRGHYRGCLLSLIRSIWITWLAFFHSSSSIVLSSVIVNTPIGIVISILSWKAEWYGTHHAQAPICLWIIHSMYVTTKIEICSLLKLCVLVLKLSQLSKLTHTILCQF